MMRTKIKAILAVSAVLAMAFGILSLSYASHRRLMNDCMADGNKEYQCIGILNGRY